MDRIRSNLLAILTGLLLTASSFGEANTITAEEVLPGTTLVYIGTYTGANSDGIYVARLDPESGSLGAPELAVKMTDPSWVTVHPNGKFLYAAGESGDGSVAGFKIEPDGHLSSIKTQLAGGRGPCHLAIDPTGKTVLASNYIGGSVASLQIAPDGALSVSDWLDQFPTLGKMQKPHAHHAAFDPSNRFALVCDAGLDRIWVYRFDATTGRLTPNDPPFVATVVGTHPRHLTFSKNGKFCYSINEKAMSVTAFQFDSKTGMLQSIQSISTLPTDFKGKAGSTAELIMHPSGEYLYGSNRGPDNIVCYRVDPQSGRLTLVGHTNILGETARSFGIDPSGRWMIVGHQNSDSIIQFEIDQNTGELAPTGTKHELGSPVCFQFLEVEP